MSLYGLDFIVDKQGKPFLLEVNGVRSGMSGFAQVYGDDRVEDRVYYMLEQRYGKLTIDDGTYARNEHELERWIYEWQHPIKCAFWDSVRNVLETSKRSREYFGDPYGCYKSVKAERDLIVDIGNHDINKRRERRYPVYDGQDSTVLNWANHKIEHPTVNNRVCESVAGNKFLQYALLKDTEVAEFLPRTTLVGLGFLHYNEWTELTDNSEQFVTKPILGIQGLGVRFVDKRHAKSYITKSGGIHQRPHNLEMLDLLSGRKNEVDLKKLVETDYWSFEDYMAILQERVDTGKRFETIRSIVCNGEFVDAYKRVSDEPRVNLSRGASAEECDVDLSEMSERIVSTLETESKKLDPKTFKKDIYLDYIVSAGDTALHHRQMSSMFNIIELMMPRIDQ